MDRRVGIEPTMFRNLAGIEPDGQLPHSTTLVYLRIYKAHKSVALPTKLFSKRLEKSDLNRRYTVVYLLYVPLFIYN